jgi:hypothetical protein
MEEPIENDGQSQNISNGQIMNKRSGPHLEKVLEDDEFIPELRLKNEHLLKL